MRVLGLLFLLHAVLSNPVPEDSEADAVDTQFMKHFVQSLFESERDGREIEDEALNALEAAEGEAVEENDEKSMSKLVEETNPAEIEKFNSYVDAIYRRMNAALRAKLMDPMTLNLNSKSTERKSGKSKKNKKGKGREMRELDFDEEEDEDEDLGLEEDEDEDEEDMVDRIGKATEAKEKKKKKGKKNKKEVDELEADDEDDEDEDEMMEDEDGDARKMSKKKKKKGGKKNQKKLSPEERQKKKADKQKNKGEKKGKNKGGKKKAEGRKNNKKNKGGKGGKNKGKEVGADEQLRRAKRNNHHHNKKSHKGNKKGREQTEDLNEGKAMGSLSGIATLRRSKDVEVMSGESYKIVKSEFNVGPLQLEVSKTFGKKQAREVKSAKAVTEKLQGKMTLKVKPDGSAHVKSVVFQKPDQVDVRGSLGQKKKRSDTYIRRSVNGLRSLAARRVLKMARFVLKSPSTVERS